MKILGPGLGDPFVVDDIVGFRAASERQAPLEDRPLVEPAIARTVWEVLDKLDSP